MVWKQISSLVNEFIPIGIAMKGLEKLNPKLKSFIGSATAAGYGANEIIKFLREKSNTDAANAYKNQLEQSEAAGTARPDEAANLRKLNQAEIPGDILQGAGTLGAAALGGLGGAALAGKGAQAAATTTIQGLKQKVGQVAAPVTQAYKAQEGLATPVFSGRAVAGVDTELNRLKAAANKTALQAPQSTNISAPIPQVAKTSFDILKKRHPIIGKFLEGEVNKGKTLPEAAVIARTKKMMMTPISELEAEVGQPFEDFINQISGGGQATSQVQSAQYSPQETQRIDAVMAKANKWYNGLKGNG